MRLYKYVASSAAAAALAGGSLKFTPVPELNDPMEVLPFFDEAAVAASLELLRRDGCSEDQLTWLNRQQALLDMLVPSMGFMTVPTDAKTVDALYRFASYDNLPLLRTMLVATIDLIRSKVGILSLSERADCIPMWAHYAAGAAGFVVAIDDLDLRYPGDATGSLNAAKPVVYTERFLGMTFDASTQDRLFFAKIDDWRYEKEWRVVRPLGHCRFEPLRSLHLDEVPCELVRAVICGWNVADAEVEGMRRAVGEANTSAAVIRARIEDGEFRLDRPLPE